MFWNSARKAYSSYGNDPEIKFKQRRSSIRTYLPALSGYDVQKRVEVLNDDLATLKEEIKECQNAILQIKAGTDPERARYKFGASWSLSTRPKEVIDCFKDRVDDRKQVARWIRRERAIYLWELRLRKVGALKLPLIRQRLDGLNKEASEIVVALRRHMEQVDQLLERHRRVSSETSELQKKVHKLSLENQQSIVSIPRVPDRMKETTQKHLKELGEMCVGLN